MLGECLQGKQNLEKEEIHQIARLLNLSEQRIKRWYEKWKNYSREVGLFAKGEKLPANH